MLRAALSLFVIAYLPGALLFRLPFADRAKRAALPADERFFWTVLLSLAVSSTIALALAAAGAYRFDRLLWLVAAASLLAVLVVRGGFRFDSPAPRPTAMALLPIGVALLGCCLFGFVPPAEYVIGGKDPGVYMNEGIQIAQRGGLWIHDPIVTAVPAGHRALFFQESGIASYYSNRFMGFFLLDPDAGTVVGQFPHLFPMWIALGYGVSGLTGARMVTVFAAVLGLLAVYFAGTRLLGRAAACAGAALLALNVAQVWYARYPNAEIVMQPLAFAALAAYARACLDDDRFFGPAAALFCTLAMFAHLTGTVLVAGVAAAAFADRLNGGRFRWSLLVPLAAGVGLAAVYVIDVLPPYFELPLGFFRNLTSLNLALLALAALAALALLKGAGKPAVAGMMRRWVPAALVAAVWIAALYAYGFRTAGGTLAAHDADALRTLTAFYVTPLGLAAALIGFAILARRFTWSCGALPLTAALFSLFFFYKIRIVPEHFWAARRFLAVILPSFTLLAGAAAFSPVKLRFRAVRYGIGAALVLTLAVQYLGASRAILRHVEYAGVIPHLEQLASTFGDDDLVLVESRAASDTHVLGLPLAYIYARNVLVLASANPDKGMFRTFLDSARARYRRIFFIGSGGTELLSRGMSVEPIRSERFQVPEYESAWNAYPTSARSKEFDFSVYELTTHPAVSDRLDLRIGDGDDLYVRRFFAKERRPDGSTFRWTRDESYVSILGTRPEQRSLTLWLDNGGRPASAGPAAVDLFLDGRPLGSAVVNERGPYRFEIPADLAGSIARADAGGQLRIVSRTWSPAAALGGNDTRDLGVMLDRIEITAAPSGTR